MSGSIDWFLYTADSGTKYTVKVDRSNAVALGFDEFTGGNEAMLPQGTKIRGINCVNADGARKFFKVGKNSDPNYNGTNKKFTIDDTEWYISSTRGEKSRRAIEIDTGETDEEDEEEGEGGAA